MIRQIGRMIGYTVIPILSLYTLGSLISWEFNPGEWSDFVRSFLSCMAFLWWLITVNREEP